MKASLALLVVLASVGVVAQMTPPSSGIDETAIDNSGRAGDGFDAFANGKWSATASIPDDRSSISVGQQVSVAVEQRNADIIKSARSEPSSPNAKKIADFYTAFLDTKGIESRGLAPLKTQLGKIYAIHNRESLSAFLGSSIRSDTDIFNNANFHTENLFGLFITQDLNRPKITVPYLMQGGLGLPDRDYYLSTDPQMIGIRRDYVAYVARQLANAGLSDPSSRALRIIALETKIAESHADIVTSQNAHKGNNPWTRADFGRRAPGINWNVFWRSARLPNQRDFIVWQPATVSKMSELVAREPISTWQDWLVFHTISQEASVLPKTFDDDSFAFFGKTLAGTPSPRSRENRAVSAVNESLGDAVGKIYADRYFPASSRAAIHSMVANIVAAFDHRLAELQWLSPLTKSEARRKLASLRVGVGYGDKWRDYSSLLVSPSDPVGNLQRARLAEYRHQITKLGKPVDRDEWWMTPQTVNAVNLPLQNALNFPAAILQQPYFDPAFDAAANYGAIGAGIGHEISHAFDDLGSDFDSTGKFRNWWTPADLKRFHAAGTALISQFDAYEAFPGLHLNGRQELSENIADVAGLTAAYEAYRASLGGKEAPVIDGFTGDQRFFLAFAQSWRTKMRERRLRALIATDGHAPASWRIETVRNLDAWYTAFGVKPGDKMYLAPQNRVHVW